MWTPADHLLLFSSAYGTGSRALELRQSGGKTAVKERWAVNRVRVLRAWKGVTEDRVNLTWVESDRWMGDKVFWDAVRGIPFSGSDTLVVAAWWHEGALATGFCTFTLARYGGAQTATALLGPGTVPTARASVVHVGLWWPWPAVVGAVLLATAGLLRLWRQARSGHTR